MAEKSSATSLKSKPSGIELKKKESKKRIGAAPSSRRDWGLSGTPRPEASGQGCFRPHGDDEELDKEDFIYGGPFIPKRKVDGFLNTATPLNVQLSGIYKRSYAYDHLKEILPIVLTKVIDQASRGGNVPFVQHVSKAKSNLVTNKKFEKFAPASEDAEEWNEWIDQLSVDNEKHFLNAWSWTESYVYRKLYEGAELSNSMGVDYFAAQKNAALQDNIEPMCVIAERLITDMCQPKEERKEVKEDFAQLCKVSMWATRYSLPAMFGEPVDPAENCPAPILPLPKPGKPPKKPKKGAPPGPPPLTDVGYIDPFQINLDLKPNTLLDDSPKALDMLEKRAVKLATQREKFTAKCLAGAKFKQKCSCERIARLTGEAIWKYPGEPPDPGIVLVGDGSKKGKKDKGPKPPPPDPNAPRIVCPAKRTAPEIIYLDIVVSHAGYELFTDLCIAHYVIYKQIVEKVRIHVKKYPWHVLDATEKDLLNLINALKSASFNKVSEPPPPAKPTEEPPEPRNISSSFLNELGNQWNEYIQDGTFVICADDYWTYPHTYTTMKKYDIYFFKELQNAAMIIWKGDLNYRKLMGERNCVPTDKFEPCLQGFQPAPHLAIRTIQSEILCGLPKGRKEQMDENFTDKWIRNGDFGTIQMSKKAEAMPKKPDRPCVHYGDTCFSEVCPTVAPLPGTEPPPPPPEEAPAE